MSIAGIGNLHIVEVLPAQVQLILGKLGKYAKHQLLCKNNRCLM